MALQLFRRQVFIHVFIVFIVFLIINFVAAAILGAMEGLDYTNSFYLSMSASCSTGYGNVATETVAGKWFISFFQVFGYAFFFYIMSVVTAVEIKNEKI
jgi:Ion channel